MPNLNALFLNAVYLTGPTAVGKSEISLRLAEDLGAVIVALDAMTLYQGMNIGTAKPSLKDQARVPHHLLDIVSPQHASSLDQYLAAAQTALEDISHRGRTALFVGGSPLYLKACLRGLSELPDRDETVRDRLEAEAASEGVATLYARLQEIDPETAAKIAGTDLRRIVRALEIYETSGEIPSRLRGRHEELAPPHVPVIALVRPRPELYGRINTRVEAMFREGLIEEAAALPRPLSHTAQQAVGYAEAFAVLDGSMTIAQAIEKTQLRTRHYAKHQMTWFRNLKETKGFHLANRTPEANAALLLDAIKAIRSGQNWPGDPLQ